MSAGPTAARTVKCVVWDLDGTLWEGVWADLKEPPALKAGVAQALRQLDALGVLQSAISRAPREAWRVLEAATLDELFLAPRLGWEGAKSAALAELAHDLDLGLDGFVFVDDSAWERAEVSAAHPQVRCVDGGAWEALWALDGLPREVTPQGQARRAQYKAQEVRAAAARAAQGPPEGFLRTLGMELRVGPAREEELGRWVELMERTQQWNSTGLRLGAEALRPLLRDPGWWACSGHLRDRFGDDGLCAAALAQREGDAWVVRLWVVSCRVQDRGVGHAFLGHLIGQAQAQGLGLALELRRTERNKPLRLLLRLAGFTEGPRRGPLDAPARLVWPAGMAPPCAPWVCVRREEG